MPAFDLPSLSLPFPARLNAHHDRVNETCRAWFVAMGFENPQHMLCEYASTRSCDLVARGFPGIGPAELENVTLLTFWMFLLDDGLDQGTSSLPHVAARQHLDRIFALISGSTRVAPAQTALERSGVILMSRMLDDMTPTGRTRFLDEIRLLFDWVSHEVEVRSQFPSRVPDLASIIRQRRVTSAAMVIFRAGEYANHAELPEAFHRSLLFEALQDSATDVIAMVNDLFSYEKEKQHLETQNYVVVCQHLLGGNLDEAVAFFVRLLDTRVRSFEQARERLPQLIREQAFSSGERQAIELFVDMLENWMRGNLDWSVQVPRYNDIRRQPSTER